jgi:hypothetical protein
LQERYESDAKSWSAERASLEVQLAKQLQESLAAIEKLKFQVLALPSYRKDFGMARFIIISIYHAL